MFGVFLRLGVVCSLLLLILYVFLMRICVCDGVMTIINMSVVRWFGLVHCYTDAYECDEKLVGLNKNDDDMSFR